MKKRIFLAGILSVMLCLSVAACSSGPAIYQLQKPQKGDEIAIIHTVYGDIKLRLFPDEAPMAVENFVTHAKEGYYDGLTFHRIIKDFMIQGGDPQGIGTGGPGYDIKGEFSANGFQNDLKHIRGVISMARAQHPDSAGSQFFIMVDDAPYLDGQYAAFGKVIEGMEQADRIVSAKRDFRDKPYEDQKMVKVTVDTFGVPFDEPEVC